MRVAIFCTCPKGVFSGGRYHAMMAAAVLARRGHEAYFITNNSPLFANDLAVVSPENPVAVVETPDFEVGSGTKFDFVLLAPQMGHHARFYRSALRFARDTGAALGLINYETPNWFNSLSPTPRPPEKWDEWNFAPKDGCLILCSARESERYAREYFQDIPAETKFDVWQPAINSVACRNVPALTREKRIVLFSRPHDMHKGGDDIAALMGADLAGYTLSVVIGDPKRAGEFVAELASRGSAYGVQVEPQIATSDEAKFRLLKSSAAMVFPSYFEGYGYPPLEALASDLPCVAYDLPVIRENCGDLVRYASPGDVDALRSQLIEALHSEPRQTSLDPRIHWLTDVDERGEALETVLSEYRRGREQSAQTSAVPRNFEFSKVSVFQNEANTLAFLTIATHVELGAVSAPGADRVQLVRGEWRDGVRRYAVLLTLREPEYGLDALRGLTLHVQVGSAVAKLDLDQVELAGPIAQVPRRAAAIERVCRRGNHALVYGWAYPTISYDALYLITSDGTLAKLDTAVKNTQYRTFSSVDFELHCGFVGAVDGLFDDQAGDALLLYARAGTVAGTMRIPRNALPDPLRLTWVGTPRSDADVMQPGPNESELDTSASVPVPASAASLALLAAQPLVSVPDPPRGVELLKKKIARARKQMKRTAKKLGLIPKPPEPVKWAVSDWVYDAHEQEVIIRGWSVLPAAHARVEIWLADGITLLGEAETGLSRRDVSEKQKTPGRDDFGFSFKQKCDYSQVNGMKLRLFDRTKLIAERVANGIGLLGDDRAKLSVSDFHYDSVWRVLWMRGVFDNATFQPSRLEVFQNQRPIAQGVFQDKVTPAGNHRIDWRVETRLESPLEPGDDLLVRAISDNGAVKRTVYRVPDLPKVPKKAFGQTGRLGYSVNDALAGMLEPGSTPLTPQRHLILLVVHNLNAIERPEKRKALEELRMALHECETELLILHHAKAAAGCEVPVVNFYSPALQGLCAARNEDLAYLEADPTAEYCRKMLYGFLAARGRRPEPWKVCVDQVEEEVRKLSAIINLATPDMVLLWHQWNSLMTLGRWVAQRAGIPSAFVHEGMLPGTMTADERGMMAEASCVGVTLDLASGPAEHERARLVIDEVASKMLDRKPTVGAPAAEQVIATLRERGAKVLFYAGINDWQSGNLPHEHASARIHSPHFVDTNDALEALVALAQELNYYVLFKPHPNLFPRPLEISDERLICVREASTPVCITLCDATVTILSSVSYVSLAHGKPTVLLGRNTLSGAQAAYELTRRDQLAPVLRAALDRQDLPAKLQRYEDHVAALLKDHLYPYGGKTDFAMRTYSDLAGHLTYRFRQRSSN